MEELLRYDGPSKMEVRTVRDDVEIRDHQLRAGDRLFLVPAAANRDPRQFPEPDRFDISRESKAHIGFGTGIHYCLGAPLADSRASSRCGPWSSGFRAPSSPPRN